MNHTGGDLLKSFEFLLQYFEGTCAIKHIKVFPPYRGNILRPWCSGLSAQTSALRASVRAGPEHLGLRMLPQ